MPLLPTIADQRGKPIDQIRTDFRRYLEFAAERDAAAPFVKGYEPGPYNELRKGETFVPLLSLAAMHGLPDNTSHMASIEQLRFGTLVGDALGIDPVFGALLSPTGGLPSAGNQVVSSRIISFFGGRDVVVPHGIAHDAAGYLLNYHAVGLGYQYAPTDSIRVLDRTNPLAGQFGGIDFFWNLKHYGTPRRPISN
jgi:hypothetical protein